MLTTKADKLEPAKAAQVMRKAIESYHPVLNLRRTRKTQGMLKQAGYQGPRYSYSLPHIWEIYKRKGDIQIEQMGASSILELYQKYANCAFDEFVALYLSKNGKKVNFAVRGPLSNAVDKDLEAIASGVINTNWLERDVRGTLASLSAQILLIAGGLAIGTYAWVFKEGANTLISDLYYPLVSITLASEITFIGAPIVLGNRLNQEYGSGLSLYAVDYSFGSDALKGLENKLSLPRRPCELSI